MYPENMKKNRLKVLIVDDEKDARDLLRGYLEKNTGISEIQEASSAEDALFKLIDLSPDMVFLDLVMPGRGGLTLIELLKKKKLRYNLVIMSEQKDSAITAIKNDVYDFLLKPLKSNDVKSVVEKYRLKKKNTGLDEKLVKVLKNLDTGEKIKISSLNSHILIDPNDILYCEAQGSYTILFLENGGKEMSNSYLGLIEKSLSDQHFFRISRSFLINLDKLSQVNRGDNSCTLISGEKEIKIYGSRKQLKILCETDFE